MMPEQKAKMIGAAVEELLDSVPDGQKDAARERFRLVLAAMFTAYDLEVAKHLGHRLDGTPLPRADWGDD